MISNKNKLLIPVIILTGFLGSGKTRFLSKILEQKSFSNSAVIINEFGEVGLDHLLVETIEDQIFALPNGCLCCSARGALIDQMLDLASRQNSQEIQFKRLIIETSGVSDAENLVQNLWRNQQICSDFSLAKIITVISADNWDISSDNINNQSSQLAISDMIFVSKADMLQQSKRDEKLARLISSIELLNSSVEIFVLPLKPEDLIRSLSSRPVRNNSPKFPVLSSHNTTHFKTVTLTAKKPVPLSSIDSFLNIVQSKHGEDLLRIKGLCLINEREHQPMVVQSVKTTTSPHYFLSGWQVRPATSLTLIFTGNHIRSITDIFQAVFNIQAIDQADSLALTDNPLSIPGVGKFIG